MGRVTDEIRDVARFNHILAVMAQVGLRDLAERMSLKIKRNVFTNYNPDPKYHYMTTPEKLRIAFETLGPTFIKFGQLLSVRPDLVPKEYIIEFSKLQDEVQPFDTEEAKEIIQMELGQPIWKVFKNFSPKPISAASIAQVHKAELKDGTPVIIKVQRPHISKIIKSDLHILYLLASLMEKYIPDSKKYNPHEVVREFSKWINKELDFTLEMRNIERAGENLKFEKRIVIPEIFPEYCTKRVLVAEYLDGKKLKDWKGTINQRKQVVTTISEVFLKQVIEDGFFHADPHPGNLLILKGNKIGLIDFGIVGNLNDELKLHLSNLLLGLVDKNVNEVVESVMDMNISDSDTNIKQLRDDIRANLDAWYMKDAKDYVASDLIELTKIAHDNNIRLPLDFILLTKQILTLDGVITLLYPDYNYVKFVTPYMEKFKRTRFSVEAIKKKTVEHARHAGRILDKLPSQLYHMLRKLEKGKINIALDHGELRQLTDLTREVEKAAEKMALAVVVAAALIGSALFAQVETLPMIYGYKFSNVVFVVTALFGMWLVASILRVGERY